MRRLRLFTRRTEAEKDLAVLERELKRTRKGMRKHRVRCPRGEELAYEEFLLLGQVRRAREAVEQESAHEI
ncbi:hypothetical protein GCM10009789_83250 [Kribbella sancticallisti]|uniref:Uncharacterized protein n=1 Tax=Kribbella sancticallisti TaxID=460087 RepID=A0ABP4QTF0_9ACTN